ncbi:MAG: pyridoxal kinase [Rhodospirillaceae bacterium]|nr:pyridoxal kinase [Rhodospirillaceae bacterium]
MQILSIQSHVVYGHVGNAAVLFPLQRLGHEVWPVPTAILSNHAGYPDFGGQALAPAVVAELLQGIERRGAFARCDLMITGYFGLVDTAAAVCDAVAQVRAASPELVYCCDPVMGDSGSGLYVDPALPEFFRTHVLPIADIATPNLFELELLRGIEPGRLATLDADELLAAARGLIDFMRPDACCLVTSAVHRNIDPENVAVLAVNRDAAWCVETPNLRFAIEPHGVGDLVSGLFAASMADHGEMARALEESVAIVFAVLSETQHRGSGELDLVAARDSIVTPPQQFAARMIV